MEIITRFLTPNVMMALGGFIAGLIIAVIIKRILFARIKGMISKGGKNYLVFIHQVLNRIYYPLVIYLLIILIANFLELPQTADEVISFLGVAIIFIVGTIVLSTFIAYLINNVVLGEEEDEAKRKSYVGIIVLLQSIIWILGIVFLVDNVGYDVTTVIAGLGIGGIAIALAAQAVLGDLFSYFAILLDRPFEVNDFIIVGDFMGTIEKTGIKTTRIRSLGGEQLVFSNSDLTSSRLKNYGKMEERRVVFKFGVIYSTTLEQLKQIPGMVQEIIDHQANARFDRAHFQSYGDSSLNFEVVYYVLTPDYKLFMDIQQEINFELKEKLENAGIDFAYPTQTLFLHKME